MAPSNGRFAAKRLTYLPVCNTTPIKSFSVWIWNVDDRQSMNSELHQEIDRRFREANIEIAFPQSDLHLRSVEESVHLIDKQIRFR
jgi:small-conductance mechanosensitive channel